MTCLTGFLIGSGLYFAGLSPVKYYEVVSVFDETKTSLESTSICNKIMCHVIV